MKAAARHCVVRYRVPHATVGVPILSNNIGIRAHVLLRYFVQRVIAAIAVHVLLRPRPRTHRANMQPSTASSPSERYYIAAVSDKLAVREASGYIGSHLF